MAALTCCGNQPTPIIIGLLVTYLTGLIDCYPMSQSPPSSDMSLGKIVYRPNYSSHSSSSSQSSADSSSSPLPSASSPQSPVSIVSPPSSASAVASSSSPPVASQPSFMRQLPQPASSSYHHSPSYGPLPGITLIRGPMVDDDGTMINPRSRYHDYLDTFPLPLRSNGIEQSGNNIALMASNGLSSGTKGIKSPKFIFSQQSAPQIDFDYIPYIQSDFNPIPSSSFGPERSGGSSDLYEEPDYPDPIYDLKYDPIEDSNWFNEPASSSYRQQQQQQQPVLPPLSLLSPPSSPYYSSYPSPSSSGSGSSSEEMLANLMVDYVVKEMERNAQQQSLSKSPEQVQHLIRLQQHHHHPLQQQQKQPIDELKAYESLIEKKSTPLSSFNRDKGSSSSSSTDKTSNTKKESDSVKRIEQRGQKEYPMLRPATENNGKDEMDNSPSLTSQLQSLSSSTSPTSQPVERTDEEVNQLKSLLQSA